MFWIIGVFLLTGLSGCSQQTQVKINGVSLVASPDLLTQENLQPIVEVNANYASVMPFGFIKNTQHPDIQFNTSRQWYGETEEGIKQYIDLLHKNNIQVMLKPQLWIWHGEFTGLLRMQTEENWIELEQSYQAFILTFARIAEETQCRIFCIGTELELFINHRPQFWKELIEEIKKIYSGKLTYAANWDEYKRVPFWEHLDYIGIDAYFPISTNKTPALTEAKQSWIAWEKEMKRLSIKTNKKILFTEYGYRSVDYAGKEPWKSHRDITGSNLEAQAILTQALYEEVWNEEWFSGGFIWKWFPNHKDAGGKNNNQFTPQNKPVQQVIKQQYKHAN